MKWYNNNNDDDDDDHIVIIIIIISLLLTRQLREDSSASERVSYDRTAQLQEINNDNKRGKPKRKRL